MTIAPVIAPSIDPALATPPPSPVGDVVPAGTAAPAQAELFGYLAQHGASLHSIGALTAAGQAEQLANPATLGDRILASMRGFPEEVKKMKDMTRGFVGATQPGSATAAAPPADLPRGPAAAPVAPPNVGQDGPARLLGLVQQTFDFAIEAHLIGRGLTQGASAINTLIKGQ